MYEPVDALPSTPGPTQSTTVPPMDDVFCTFQENLCDFTIKGDDNFLFTRTQGNQVAAIGSDHHGNADGYFLYAESSIGIPDMVWTYVMTNNFDGEKHAIECFHFWFFIDGYLVSLILNSYFEVQLYSIAFRMAPKMRLFLLVSVIHQTM